jgi:Toprim-like
MYDRDAIIAAVDLRGLADELLGPSAGGRRTSTWRCPNPQHAQTGRTPPVTIFTSRRGEPRWRCHGCGTGGTAIDLVIECRGVDVGEALDYLARRVGQPVESPTWTRPRRRPSLERRPAQPPNECRDPEALTKYVLSCAQTLWQPAGRAVRQWLTQERGLPEDVLRANHVGADLGPGRQPRPCGMPRASGAVLSVMLDSVAIYAQVRVPHPQADRPRYLNPTADLALNPRLALFRPAHCEHPEVIVAEGAIDALTATAAGYRAVGVLSAGYPDAAVAHALSRVPHPLVIAFDPDDAGRAGAARLAGLLAADHRPAAVIDLGSGDLNEALLRTHEWPADLAEQVGEAIGRARSRDDLTISR